jgi:hypothetical protein
MEDFFGSLGGGGGDNQFGEEAFPVLLLLLLLLPPPPPPPPFTSKETKPKLAHFPKILADFLMCRKLHVLHTFPSDFPLSADTVNAMVSLRPSETNIDFAVMEDPLGFTDCTIHRRQLN